MVPSAHPQALILVTAFEPFGGQAVNPAQEALRALPDRLGARLLIKLLLPTAFAVSGRRLVEALREHAPKDLVMLGQAGGAAGLRFERLGRNLDNARIPDNAGDQPRNQPIVPGGPDTCPATLPLNAMYAAVQALGLPCEWSDDAGSFVCNHALYTALHYIAQRRLPTRAGFLHLPWLPGQAAQTDPPAPSIALDKQLQAVLAALGALG